MEQKQLINTHTYREWSCDKVSCVMVQWLYTGIEHAQRGIMGWNIWGVIIYIYIYVCLGLFRFRNCLGNLLSKQKRDSGWIWLYIVMIQWSDGGYILYECMLVTKKKHWMPVSEWLVLYTIWEHIPSDFINYDIEKAVTVGWYSFWLV